MIKITWNFSLNGQPCKIHQHGAHIHVNDQEVQYVKNKEYSRFEFVYDNHVIFIVDGNYWSLGLKKKLFVDGVNIQTGEMYIQPKIINPALYVLIFVVFFILGFAFGIFFLVPLLIYIVVILCIYKKQEHHIHATPMGDPNFVQSYFHQHVPTVQVVSNATTPVVYTQPPIYQPTSEAQPGQPLYPQYYQANQPITQQNQTHYV